MHPLVKRAIRILVAHPKGKLVADIATEELISTASSQNDLVAALHLRQDIVQRQDHRSNGELVEVLDDVGQPHDQAERLLGVHYEKPCAGPLHHLLREDGLVALRVGIVAVVGDLWLCDTRNQARVEPAAAKRRERGVADRGRENALGDQVAGFGDPIWREPAPWFCRRSEDVLVAGATSLAALDVNLDDVTW